MVSAEWVAHHKGGFAPAKGSSGLGADLFSHWCVHTCARRASQSLGDFCHHPVNHYRSRAVFSEISDLFCSPEGFMAASEALAGVWIACWQPASWPWFRARQYGARWDCAARLYCSASRGRGATPALSAGWEWAQGTWGEEEGASLGDREVRWKLRVQELEERPAGKQWVVQREPLVLLSVGWCKSVETSLTWHPIACPAHTPAVSHIHSLSFCPIIEIDRSFRAGFKEKYNSDCSEHMASWAKVREDSCI